MSAAEDRPTPDDTAREVPDLIAELVDGAAEREFAAKDFDGPIKVLGDKLRRTAGLQRRAANVIERQHALIIRCAKQLDAAPSAAVVAILRLDEMLLEDLLSEVAR